MYKEIKPSIGLDKVIDSFWTFSGNKESESFKILPDSCTDLIFDFTKNKSFVSGVMTNYQFRKLAISSDIIGIRFRTENFGLMTKTPLTETKNLRIELKQVMPNYQSNILAQLNDFSSINDRIDSLENFVIKTISGLNKNEDLIILSIAESIRFSKGNINIQNLANSNFISLRQLERRFKNYIGLTIKEFSSIVRFNSAKTVISNLKKTSLLEIAFDMGFFDHSHMTNEFKRISGENPSHFR